MRRTPHDAPMKAPLVLVVDDDARAADALAARLLGRGFNAVSAASCLEARAVMDAIAIEGLVGNLGLRDGSLFDLARALRTTRAAVVIGYADVHVRRPPELDACFTQPLDLDALATCLAVRFGRHRSGEHVIASRHLSIPPARAVPAATRRRR